MLDNESFVKVIWAQFEYENANVPAEQFLW